MNGTAIMALAHWIARKAIQKQWRDQGIKVSHVPVAELTHAARAYLASHPELIEEARARVRSKCSQCS